MKPLQILQRQAREISLTERLAVRIERLKDESSYGDIKAVMFYMFHIDNPCGDDITREGIRQGYLREAKKLLDCGSLTNPYAIDMLEAKVRQYETESSLL